mmetsp:Transcript_23159/g.65895  ORF Transcript_23159/g.65895 Transcript_23159/m.65895 type:complete len:517 (+) Transcript_23159:489-2039(+)
MWPEHGVKMAHEGAKVHLAVRLLCEQIKHFVGDLVRVAEAAEECPQLLPRDAAVALQVQHAERVPGMSELEGELLAQVLHEGLQLSSQALVCALPSLHWAGGRRRELVLESGRHGAAEGPLGVNLDGQAHSSADLGLDVGREVLGEHLVRDFAMLVVVEPVEELVCGLLRKIERAEEVLHLAPGHGAVLVVVDVAPRLVNRLELKRCLLADDVQDLVELFLHVLGAAAAHLLSGRLAHLRRRAGRLARGRRRHHGDGRRRRGPAAVEERGQQPEEGVVVDLLVALLVQIIEQTVSDVGPVIVRAEEMPHLAAVNETIVVCVDEAKRLTGGLELLDRLLRDSLAELSYHWRSLLHGRSNHAGALPRRRQRQPRHCGSHGITRMGCSSPRRRGRPRRLRQPSGAANDRQGRIHVGGGVPRPDAPRGQAELLLREPGRHPFAIARVGGEPLRRGRERLVGWVVGGPHVAGAAQAAHRALAGAPRCPGRCPTCLATGCCSQGVRSGRGANAHSIAPREAE